MLCQDDGLGRELKRAQTLRKGICFMSHCIGTFMRSCYMGERTGISMEWASEGVFASRLAGEKSKTVFRFRLALHFGHTSILIVLHVC